MHRPYACSLKLFFKKVTHNPQSASAFDGEVSAMFASSGGGPWEPCHDMHQQIVWEQDWPQPLSLCPVWAHIAPLIAGFKTRIAYRLSGYLTLKPVVRANSSFVLFHGIHWPLAV